MMWRVPTPPSFLLDSVQEYGLSSHEGQPGVDWLLLAAQANNLSVIYALQSKRLGTDSVDDHTAVGAGYILYQCLSDLTIPIDVCKILAKHHNNKAAVQSYIYTLDEAEGILNAMKERVRESLRWFGARSIEPQDTTSRLLTFF
jgi:hypothetical protein